MRPVLVARHIGLIPSKGRDRFDRRRGVFQHIYGLRERIDITRLPGRKIVRFGAVEQGSQERQHRGLRREAVQVQFQRGRNIEPLIRNFPAVKKFSCRS